MAKRNTTGKPRKARDTEHKLHRSKAEQERYYQQLALIFGGVVIAIVVVAIMYALVNDYLLVPERAITTVNGESVKTKEFQRRYRAERWFFANEITEAIQISGGNDQLLSFYLQNLEVPAPYNSQQNGALIFLQDENAFGRFVMQQLELQVALEQEADSRGVKVDEDAIQAQVDDYITRWTGVSLTPTPESSATAVSSATPTPLITATASNTPTPTDLPTETPLPTVEGCEGDDCATVTPPATLEPTEELPPTETPTLLPTVEGCEGEDCATVTPTVPPTNTPLPRDKVESTLDNFDEDYFGEAKDIAKVDRDVVYDIFYLRALRLALRDEIAKDLPTESVWAESRHILVSADNPDPNASGATFDPAICETDAWQTAKVEADAIYSELQAGEPFALLAQTASDDPGSGANGGNLDWAEVEQTYVESFADAIVNAQVGAITEPVCSQFGWHIIQVLDREVREVNAIDLRQRQQEAYQEWEDNLLIDIDVERDENWTEHIPSEPTYDELLGDLYPSS